MKYVRYWLVFSFIFAIIIPGFSQDYLIERLTTKDGLPQNDVNTLFQDSDGFLWVGTNDGLSLFDGYSFRTFNINPSDPRGLSSNLIFSLDEDHEKNLWLGTTDHGIIKFDLRTETFESFYNTPQKPDLLGSNQIGWLTNTKEGTVWVASRYGDIDLFATKHDSLYLKRINRTSHPEFTSNFVNVIRQDHFGRIWVGGRSSLYVFADHRGDKIEYIKRVNNEVRDIYISEGYIYVCYNSYIARYDDAKEIGTPTIMYFSGGYYPTRILVTKNNNLFIATNEGLVLYNLNHLDNNRLLDPVHFVEGIFSNQLSSNQITFLLEDQSGIIWIGTKGGGINKLNLRKKGFRHFKKTPYRGSIGGNKIRAIYEDREQNLWIGTEGDGISFLSHKDSADYENGFKTIHVNQNTKQDDVYSFVDMNKEGPVDLIAGCGYLDVTLRVKWVNGKLVTEKPELLADIKNSPFAMIRDRNGNVWFGTYGLLGLYILKKDGTHSRMINIPESDHSDSLSSNNIRSLLEDDHGNIWIGTDQGLNLVTPDEQLKDRPAFRVFKHKDGDPTSISHNYILPLFQSKDGTIWVGTMGGGLNKMNYHSNPDSISFTKYTTRNGLPNNSIKGILEDDYGALWISSNKGLTRFDVKSGVFKNFNLSDGIQDYEFGEVACYKRRNGDMVFGGVNGINVFSPIEILNDMVAPKIALTDFQVLNQSIKVGENVRGRVILTEGINYSKKIKLKYAENSFAVYFSSLHFSSSANNKYKYMLEGFDPEWIHTDADERFAKYTNLSPGKYTFRVLSSNNDGVWSNDPKVLEIVIVPPWWMSHLALIAYVLLLISMIWFFQRYSLIRIRQKNELLMEHFEREKIEELSQMKLRFFTNISHEFRTPLTLIIGPLDKLTKNWGVLSEQQVLKNFSVMRRNAAVLMNLINQLIDFRKLEQGKMKVNAIYGNIVPFLHDVFDSFSELSANRSIEYVFTATNEDLKVWFDVNILERIMYNLLSNAFKFTSDKGRIEVVVDQEQDNILLRVIDNGIGIPKEMQEHIFERFYQAKRIDSNGKSTGIGLSFIKGLVELHKGVIYFESEENKGSVFTVKLPKGDAHLTPDQMNSPLKDSGEVISIPQVEVDAIPVKVYDNEPEETHEGGKPIILVIEDNFELAEFLSNNLSEKYNVYTAENGEIGLEMVDKLDPDVIVSDVMMPVKSGFEVCKAIKEDENICHKIVILLTAKTNEESKIEGYTAGADAYISKPFSLEILEARIANLLQSRAMMREKFKTTLTVIPSEVTTTSIDERFLARVLAIIEENISNPDFTVEQLASDFGISKFNLNKKLKYLTENTANSFIREMRLKRAAQLLATGRYSVTDVTYEVGFSDLKYFRNCFKKAFNCSPSDYIRDYKGE